MHHSLSGLLKLMEQQYMTLKSFRSSHPEVFLGKSVLKIYSKFKGYHPCRSKISIKLQSSFIEIALRHGCSPVNLLHFSKTPFPKNTSGRLLLEFDLVMSMYNLLEYSSDCSDTTGSLWFYSKDEAAKFDYNIANNDNLKSFKY